MDDHLQKLYQKKQEILGKIAWISEPFEAQIRQFQEALLAIPFLSYEEAMILQAAREDAIAANARFMAKLAEFRLWMEKGPTVTNPIHLSLNISRSPENPPPPPPASPPKKRGLFERIRDFFSRFKGGQGVEA